jgi:REP element-mobilizing transposase RayT
MGYDPRIHHRRSIRLKGYDYSSPGFYFLTMNMQGRLPLLGEIRDGRMILSQAGKIVYWAWKDLPKHYPHVRLDAWCLMPDHMHGILVIEEAVSGSGLGGSAGLAQDPRLPRPFLSPVEPPAQETRPSGLRGLEQATRLAPLSEMIRAFKSFSARRINILRGTPGIAIWQRDYYEHIIRDEGALDRIRRYITENPARWWRLRNSV